MTDFLPSEKATPIRMPSTALFPISSADRYLNWQQRRTQNIASPYDFYIQRNNSLLNGFFTRIAVSEVVFPWNIPNINPQLGTSTLYFDVSGTGTDTTFDTDVEIACAINQGVYATCGELASILEATLDAEFPTCGFTVSFEVADNPIANGGFAIRATDAVFKLRADPTYNPQARQLYDMMGFRSYLLPGDFPSVDTEAWAIQHISGNYPSMLPRLYIDIVSESLTYNQDLKDGSSAPLYRDTLCRIYLTPEGGVMPYSWVGYENSQTAATDISGFELWNWGARPFSIHRQFAIPKQIKWSPTQPLGQVHITVYDDSSTIVPDFAGFITEQDWYMTLQVSEV